MGIMELLRYFAWGMCCFSIGLFTTYAFRNVKLSKGRVEHWLTFAGATIFCVSFFVSAVAEYIFPGPYLPFAAFIIFCFGIGALIIREVLRWEGIRRVYGGTLARRLGIFFEARHYLVLSSLLAVCILAPWVFFVLRPFNAPPSLPGVAALAITALTAVILAINERQYYYRMSPRIEVPAANPASPGRKDVLAVKAFGEFINAFLMTIEPMSRSPAIAMLAEYFESNPVLFEGCCLGEDATIDVEPILQNLERIPVENRMAIIYLSFSILATKLMRAYSTLMSREWAVKAIEECYRSVERQFRSTSAVSDLLRIIPEGILESEKLAFLSKEELEARVRERTLELEGSREQLRKLKEFHEQIVKTTPVGILRTDTEGKIIFANPKAEGIIGLANGENIAVEDRNTADIFDVEEVLKAAGVNIESLRNKDYRGNNIITGEFHVDFAFTSSKGKSIQSSISAVSLLDKDGKFDGLLLLIEDVTLRKVLEEERREIERKTQLASRLASVGEMAAGIAHEINNPLTGVIGFAQLIMARDIPPDIRDDVRIMYDGAQRVSIIVKRLLTFARRYKPERTLVNVNEIIRNTLELRAYQLSTSNIEVSTELLQHLPGTVADGGQLQQVFLNLIINAETEMRLAHGKGKLLIKTEKAGKIIKISFADDGPGITRENMERIFEPFFTTREVGQGTGLGLSVCHGIISEHGGRIYAESMPGRGATFIVELPITTRGVQAGQDGIAIGEVKKASALKILVVDDEQSIREFVYRVLTAEGNQVEAVASGTEALNRLKNDPFGLILLDIKLPGMSGIEVYKHIEELDPILAEKVVFITGDIMAPDTIEFLNHKKTPCVTKPFDVQQLKMIVNGVRRAA